MRKEDNFYSFWHKEIVPAESCRKRRKNKKGKKCLSIPEKLGISGEKKTFPEEKKEDFCGKRAVRKNFPEVYSVSGRNILPESPVKISTLSAKLHGIIHGENDSALRWGSGKEISGHSEQMEERIYSVIRQYMKENLPEESI